ncbi:MAG: MoxR family ATPase [Rhodobacterales bacterium]|nr:MoxR family ATPase [Rhodobacterales bacterium]
MTKIKCEICGAEVHAIKKHLEDVHPDMELDEYRAAYPDAPLYSEAALKKIKEISQKKKEVSLSEAGVTRRPLHEVFNIPSDTKGALSAAGGPIPIMVFDTDEDQFKRDLVPDIDPNYIFNIDTLKVAVMGLECNIPTYLVGMAGTGKSTLMEQIGARTNRPTFRVQHSGNTEESHILGQYIVKDGETVWEPGPLQIAMKLGINYLADEYDRAMPQILSVYQPVLEGKQLVTKEAPPEWRIIKPHPDFRFTATGNTNGAGDETGLFPSTNVQDFANFERFGLMIKIDWMPEAQEVAVVSSQAGIPKEDAKTLVRFAREVRKQVDAGQISSPVSPRALINAGKIGVRMRDYRRGLTLAYINRLGQAEAKACDEVAQRFFG